MVATFVAVNILGFFIVPHQGDSVFGEIMIRLFPLILLLISTRGMVWRIRNLYISPASLGKRGWQQLYNKIRVYLVLFGLGAALVRLIFDLAIIAFDGITQVIFWVVAIAVLVGNAVAVFRLRNNARELAGWGKK